MKSRRDVMRERDALRALATRSTNEALLLHAGFVRLMELIIANGQKPSTEQLAFLAGASRDMTEVLAKLRPMGPELEDRLRTLTNE